ncbi:DMT family transporter [Roseibaca sp. Y0-43]|uniref:DMT family transporter n=1 Tax=Roseibaca sp. Y0-43 TaxID=2816854 RepID=UPI001D0CBB01|nr:DMT family transporter [Roseibaca sp. Y0-43]MCC1482513.1 DMT family transporter [Roseibaca sp. Y0-43]
MRLFALTILTMIAFAANSLLNRAALVGDHIGPAEFAALRVVSGALMLWVLVSLRSGPRAIARRPDWVAVAGLVAYLVGFSFAYLQLDAGLGAVILFGGVQLTMFAGALLEGERPAALRWLGMALSLAGLVYLGWPGTAVPLPPVSLALMALAAVGWGVYSLAGRKVADPLVATASNFLLASPVVLGAALLAGSSSAPSTMGVALAILSGAITSGLGYALWYQVLPALGATRGALAQLSAPVFALLGGALLLAEPISARAALASGLILGGIVLGVWGARKPGPKQGA